VGSELRDNRRGAVEVFARPAAWNAGIEADVPAPRVSSMTFPIRNSMKSPAIETRAMATRAARALSE